MIHDTIHGGAKNYSYFSKNYKPKRAYDGDLLQAATHLPKGCGRVKQYGKKTGALLRIFGVTKKIFIKNANTQWISEAYVNKKDHRAFKAHNLSDVSHFETRFPRRDQVTDGELKKILVKSNGKIFPIYVDKRQFNGFNATEKMKIKLWNLTTQNASFPRRPIA